MTSTEFIQATNDIEKFYDKELNKFESQQWYNELKNMSIERYRYIIKQIYRKCKFMPKLADIISIDEQTAYTKGKKTEIPKEKCDICEGKGFILYNKIYENRSYQYLAHCKCANALNFIYDGTQVTDPKAKSKYYVPTLEMINLNI